MFKRVISQKGFWKSVLIMSLVYLVILFLIQWAFTGFKVEFFDQSASRFLVFALGGFIVGFAMTYGKYWGQLKRDDYRK